MNYKYRVLAQLKTSLKAATPAYFPVIRKTIQAILITLALGATLAPLGGLLAGPGYWPGFFYTPFYTTGVFTDAATPAGRAGLRPEDRVIGVNQTRIENLAEFTRQEGLRAGSLYLVYELGSTLATIQVAVEPLGWGRWLEKWGPLLGTGLALLALGWRRQKNFVVLAGLYLIAAIDYWLNPGAGRESGFDPPGWLRQGRWEMAGAKWSAYLFWPLWSLTLFATGCALAVRLFQARRSRGGWYAVTAALLAGHLGSYGYVAARTAFYNNPDFIIWHSRYSFWPGWGILLALAIGWAWLRQTGGRNWLIPVGLLIFVVGFAFPVTFEVAWPGPGPQWYAPAWLVFVYSATANTARSNSARWRV